MSGSQEAILRWVVVAKAAVGYSGVDDVCGFDRTGMVRDEVAVTPTTESPPSWIGSPEDGHRP